MKYKIRYYSSHCKEMYPHNLQETIREGESKFDAAFKWHAELAKYRTGAAMYDPKRPVIYDVTEV